MARKKHGDEARRQFINRVSKAYTTELRKRKLDGAHWNLKTYTRAWELKDNHAKMREVVKTENGQKVVSLVPQKLPVAIPLTGRVFMERIGKGGPEGSVKDVRDEGTWWGVEVRLPLNATHAAVTKTITEMFDALKE